MGQVGFLVPLREFLPAEAPKRAFLSALDQLPWQTRVTPTATGLTVERAEHESGYFHILWTTAARGRLVLITGTIVERAEPYNLPVELARGVICRLRNQVGGWEAAGLSPPATVTAQLKLAMKHFVTAATSQDRPADAAAHAQQAIEAAIVGSDLLVDSFAQQAIRMRKGQATKLAILLGGSLGQVLPDKTMGDPFLAAFNAAIVPCTWNQIEPQAGRRNWELVDGQLAWCAANDLRVVGGPLLDLERTALPDWLYLWEGDFTNILSVVTDQVRSVVTRCKGRVHLWNCAARVNTTEALSLSEEEVLRLTVRAVETVRNVDARTPVMVTFDQPWGDYLGQLERDLPPLHFADALVRSDLGLAGLGLELNLGVGAQATLPRDGMELSRQIDRWGALGLPLVILLTIPSDGDGFNPPGQLAWLQSYLQLFSAKSAVHGILWNQLRDATTPQPNSRGLLNPLGQPKPVLTALAEFRQRKGSDPHWSYSNDGWITPRSGDPTQQHEKPYEPFHHASPVCRRQRSSGRSEHVAWRFACRRRGEKIGAGSVSPSLSQSRVWNTEFGSRRDQEGGLRGDRMPRLECLARDGPRISQDGRFRRTKNSLGSIGLARFQ